MAPKRKTQKSKAKPLRILIFGASGHGKVILEALLAAKRAKVIGFVDNGQKKSGFQGLPCFGPDSDLSAILRKTKANAAVVAIGDNHKRSLVVARIRELAPQLEFPAIVHPTAYVALGAEVGEGTVVLPGAIVGADARVGRFCIVNTRASIDHDGEIGDFASLAPGAVLGGKVHVGEFSAVGLGASVIHGIRIGAQTVIGAGAVVVRDHDSHAVAYGSPARVVRKRAPGDGYL